MTTSRWHFPQQKLLRSCGKVFLLGRCCLAVITLAFGLSGCAGWNLHDEGFRKNNDLPEAARMARSAKEDKDKSKDKDMDYWSFSEKGRQIERNLGP